MAKKYTADIIEATSITGSLLGTATLASALVPGNKTVEGDLTVTGKITAEEFHTEYVSSSIVYQSGSTKFGDSSDDVMSVTGSLQVQGSITGSLFGTATNAVSSSYAVTSSYAHFAATPTVQGVQGTQGIQGIQGLQGADGYIGVDGAQGIQGIQGLQGRQGTQGIQGTAGSNGAQGTQGIQGTTGSNGAQGIQGIQGTAGSNGSQGTQGIQGTTGAQGIQGIQGVQGPNAGITSYTNASNNRVITSVDSSTINAESNLAFDGTILINYASEGREVGTYMPGSYTTDDLVSGHTYKWYNDVWRLGATRSGGQPAADFVIQFNGTRKLAISTDGNLTATGTSTGSRFGNVVIGSGTYKNTISLNGDTNLNLSTPSGAVFFDTYGEANGSLRAPIFYDLNDTGYYLNPAGNSNLYYASFANDLQLNGNYLKFDQSGTRSWSIRASGGNLNFTSGDGSGTYTFTGSASFTGGSSWFGGYGGGSGPGLSFENQSTFARIVFWGLDFYDWNHGTQMVIDNGYVLANNSMRSPIFYDSNDTAYYCDPTGTSNFAGLTIAGGRPITTDSSGGGIYIQGSGGGWATGYYFKGTSGTYRGGFGALGGNDGLSNYWIGPAYNGYYTYIDASELTHTSSVRGPIFYDSNNTGYYVDPTGTSNLADLYANQFFVNGNYNGIRFNAGASSDLVISCIPGTRTFEIRNGNGPSPNYGACGLITGYATFTTTVTAANLVLNQNPVGSTYGAGQGGPPNSIYQTAGDNDGFRIYAESPATNRVRAIFQIEDDLETESEQWVFRNKRTYSGLECTNSVTISGGGTLTAAADVVAYSDRRVKENIETIEDALDKVTKLRGVTYNRTDKKDKTQKIGVIAQEIQEVLPQVVFEQEDGMLGVSYGNITAVLIEAIKEQQTQIENQQSQIDELKALVKTLVG